MHAATRKQRGQALILTAVLIIIGFGALLFRTTTLVSTSLANQQAKNVEIELVKVRDALIGRSVQRTSSNTLQNARPGELPCPDINPLDGYEDGSCAAGALGRVPWKTLGIPEPKDEAGETLWYAVAGPFQIWGMNFTVINSDTRGDITVYQDSTATAVTTEAVAVIFAPGAPFGTQNRDPSTTALCPTTGTTIARNLCAANYLDSTGGVNNSTPTINPPLAPLPSFIAALGSDSFNDRLLVVTTADLMPVVEQRVARELRSALQAYKANSVCVCYPWADNSNGTSNTGLNRGRVPTTALPENWGSGTIPYLPGRDTTTAGWFVNNNWRLVIYYSVGRNFLEAGGGACVSCVSPDLSVDGVPGKEVVILMPGPAGVSGAHTNWPFDYFEDPQNNDHSNDSSGNDLYVTPSSPAYARDRIYTIP